MKKLLFLFLLLNSFLAVGQTSLDSNNITFTVKYSAALQVRQLVTIPEVQAAIATATMNVADTAANVQVTITENQLVQTYVMLGLQPIGIVRALNDMLMASLQGSLASHPAMAAAIMQIEAGYLAQRANLFNAGKKANTALQRAISNN